MFWNDLKRINLILRENIDELEKKNEELEERLKYEQSKNRIQEHNSLILLENAMEDRKKIKDLENNIELLKSNLTEEAKKYLN